TLSNGRRPPRSYSSGASELSRNRARSLRSVVITLANVLVRVRAKPFALLFGRGRIVGKVAGPHGSEREIVGRSGAAAEFFQEPLEHRYLTTSLRLLPAPRRPGRVDLGRG